MLTGRARLGAIVLLAAVCSAGPVTAQAPVLNTDATSSFDFSDAQGSDDGTIKRFVRDVGSDYKNFFSVETAIWLGVGGGAALGIHQADQSIADSAQNSGVSWPGGSVYGSQYFQVPAAIAWWAIASAAGSETHAETGRDLLRAQIAVASWTYGIKLAANRTRPNGDTHSFPSGHASTSFATAMVLEDHYGWKVGVPAFIAAGYTAVSRVLDNQHWTSDVVFGAALGVACARTVTIKFRETRVSIAPVMVPKGGSVLVSIVRPE
ncbi:MAG TPA: phosphatase PAP2 family protein [Vicinamibacterales bacterium]|jgi:membrane-associated phospholipid phosphatase